jgi:hypothetical protein
LLPRGADPGDRTGFAAARHAPAIFGLRAGIELRARRQTGMFAGHSV